MNDLRTAAQQALEAMEWHLARGAYGADIEGVTGNLRAALAQQAAPVEDLIPPESLFVCDQMGAHVTRVRLAQQAEPVELVVSNEALRLAGLALIGLAEHDQHCDVFDLDDQGRHKACTCGLNDAIAVITQAGKSAPPQQAEPDHETRAELAEQQVVQLAEERDHYRNLWQKAQQAEPVQEPAPMPLFPPVSQWKRGCAVCGIGADGKAYGYVCPRSDCPTKITCGGVA